MENIYLYLSSRFKSFDGLAIATVVRTSGSTPQKPGSSALLNSEGIIYGTIGGGVVEGRIITHAKDAIAKRHSGLFNYNLANSIANKEEAICGGEISILVDANPVNSLQVFSEMQASISKENAGVLATMVTPFSDKEILINRYWFTKDKTPELPEDFLNYLKSAVNEMIEKGDPYDYREKTLSVADEEPSSVFFLELVMPRKKLIIAGAGHIGRALTHLASRLDFEITIVDDRAEFANCMNIPEADRIIVGDIGKTLSELPKDRNTFIVIVTRGHKDDASALIPCIGANVAYTGMIGSRSKVMAIHNEFINKGLATDSQWEKIHAPVGLDVGSVTVEEIAVSIAAQLVQVRSANRKRKSFS